LGAWSSYDVGEGGVFDGLVNYRQRDDAAAHRRHLGGTGSIASEPVARIGTPEEIAAAVLWLCSDAATFVTGHAMVVDGGQTL
jgi:NAD(P)-dependent dehydrogenase (short-subunit alcohol dehydrogenase family)